MTRPLPHSSEAEQALLGTLLHRNHVYEQVCDVVRAEHFGDAVHGRIFSAIGKLIDRGVTANPITLKGLFDQDGSLTEIGGGEYLARLAACEVSPSNAPHYAQMIAKLWKRRELIRIGEDLAEQASSGDLDLEPEEVLNQAEQEIYAIAEEVVSKQGPASLGETLDPTLRSVDEAVRNSGKLMGVTTGLTALDEATGGLMPDELYILAGRPGMGKSTAAKTIAYSAARAGNTVLFFSLEMSKEQLTQWVLADPTGISASRMRRGHISAGEMNELVIASSDLHHLPLYIDDTVNLTIAQMRSRARRLKRANGLALIIVDHLGIARGSSEARRQGRLQEVTEISGDLKRLAKELHIPVIALCQLNRGVEGREDKRPNLADLRDSGSIEQDADAVIFAYRPEYYLSRQEPERKSGWSDEKYQTERNNWLEALERVKGLAELIIGKQRSGPTETVRVKFDPIRSRMANLDEQQDLGGSGLFPDNHAYQGGY